MRVQGRLRYKWVSGLSGLLCAGAREAEVRVGERPDGCVRVQGRRGGHSLAEFDTLSELRRIGTGIGK